MPALGEPSKFAPYEAPHKPPLFGVPVMTVTEPLAAEETSLVHLHGFEPMENSGQLVDHLGTDPKDLEAKRPPRAAVPKHAPLEAPHIPPVF